MAIFNPPNFPDSEKIARFTQSSQQQSQKLTFTQPPIIIIIMLPLLLMQAGTEAQEILQQEESGTSILELITYGLLVGAIVWLIKEIVGLLFFDNSKPPVAVPSQQQQRPKPPLRDFTADELRQYDGLHGDQVYVSILGTVYDVSSRRQFYGPGN